MLQITKLTMSYKILKGVLLVIGIALYTLLWTKLACVKFNEGMLVFDLLNLHPTICPPDMLLLLLLNREVDNTFDL